jgi:DNA invertase Pin-like site-specific DNA recombinase
MEDTMRRRKTGRTKKARPVSARHRAQLAAIYIRGPEVREGRDEGQRQSAFQLGWDPENVLVITDQANVTRPGYARLLRLVCAGEVGAVFVSDVSRIGRDAGALEQFIELLRERDVPLIVNGNIVELLPTEIPRGTP